MSNRVTGNKQAETTARQEAEFAKTLPKTFILTDPRLPKKSVFAVAAEAARKPVQPFRPKALNENGSKPFNQQRNDDIECSTSLHAMIMSGPRTRIPIAKRMHMDGVLHGFPGATTVESTQTDAFAYTQAMDDELQDRSKHKDFFRKRDAYSDYVEARARFSKMHSVT